MTDEANKLLPEEIEAIEASGERTYYANSRGIRNNSRIIRVKIREDKKDIALKFYRNM